MKKRFLLPLLLIGAPLAIGTADATIHMAGCSLGNQGACAELARREQHSAELASQHANQEAKAEDRAETREIIRAANAAVLTTAISQQQAIGCGILASKGLKDPGSFRQLNSVRDVQSTRVVEFTATNGFGGRVRNTFSCTTLAYGN